MPPPRALPTFDPASATPYFTEGAAAPARRAFSLEKWSEAVKLFDEYVKKADNKDRPQAEFLAAYASSKAGRYADAAARLDALITAWPLLADHERLYAGRAYLAAKQYDRAVERAEAVDAKSPLDGDARLVRADALARGDHAAEAEKEYREYLDHYAASWREAEARVHLAQAIDAQSAKASGVKDRWAEAAPLYLDVYLRFPTETWGKLAEERLHAREPRLLTLDGPQHLVRGLALFEAQRNADSEKELREAISLGKLDGKQSCVAAYHLAQSVFKERDRPRAAPLFDAAIKACTVEKADASIDDLCMRSLYQGARCHAAKGEGDTAAELFARAEREHPAHSFADDARLRQAEVLDALAEKARSKKTPVDGGAGSADELAARGEALLADLADKYPSGDMRSEALFRLFFRAWKKKDLAGARKWLETALVKVPREDGWWDAGRTLYWLGRVATIENKPDEAKEKFSRCAREYPLSYYALSALNRLSEQFPDDAKQLIAQLHTPVPSAADLAWRFLARPLFGEPAFLRGVELARLGLGAEAKREFAALGVKPVDKSIKVLTPDEEELLWLVTVLYDRAGEYAQSHWIPRHTLTAYSHEWPTGPNRKRWALSYPRGYMDLIIENANKVGLPPSLEFAIVREESAFDPLTESFANAIGLTQLTAAPAKRFAEGLPYTREALHDPAINVPIGARELASVWKTFDGSGPLAIGAYNAGEGAVKRWLREIQVESLDDFVESIPYDETRGYTKRVIASWFAYHWLYDEGEPIPVLPVGVPGKSKH